MGSRQKIRSELKVFLLWAISSLVIFAVTVYIIIAFNQEVPKSQVVSLWVQSLGIIYGNATTYLLATIPYLLFVLLRSIYRDYIKKNWKGLITGASIKLLLPAFLVIIYTQFIDSYRLSENFEYTWDYSIENTSSSIKDLHEIDQKHRGIHVFNLLADSTDLEILKTNNVEWLTLVPYMSQQEYDTPSLRVGFGRRDSTRRFTRYHKTKELADAYGFKIMLKPHIWLNNTPGGIWRSNIKMKTEADWDLWFQQYEAFILPYAELAEELDIELFCVGTELHTPVIEKPEKWRALIQKVKQVYSGKLTYAANWSDEVEHVDFWDELDFIGVQAYFPVASRRNPSLEHMEAGWEKHIDYLQNQSNAFNKPVLFTEIGYKSTSNAGIKPWEWNSLSNRFYRRISKRTQALAYQAFFNTVWQEPWFAGAHIWEWQSRGTRDGNDNSFTLEGKPALNIVAKGFGSVSSEFP